MICIQIISLAGACDVVRGRSFTSSSHVLSTGVCKIKGVHLQPSSVYGRIVVSCFGGRTQNGKALQPQDKMNWAFYWHEGCCELAYISLSLCMPTACLVPSFARCLMPLLSSSAWKLVYGLALIFSGPHVHLQFGSTSLCYRAVGGWRHRQVR